MIENVTQSEIDLKLKLLAGETFYVNKIQVAPKTLREIVGIGHDTYMALLGVLTAKAESYIGEESVKKVRSMIDDDVTMYDVIVHSQNEEMLNLFISACGFFLGLDITHVNYHKELGFVFSDTRNTDMEDLIILNKDTFNKISYILMYQNCVKNPEKSDFYKPKNDKARQIIEKLKKNKEKVEKAKSKKNGDSNIDLHSIISSVSTKSPTISKFNVWDLNIYQLYDEYRRLEKISSYETSVMAMMNGAKINNLSHWSTIIES